MKRFVPLALALVLVVLSAFLGDAAPTRLISDATAAPAGLSRLSVNGPQGLANVDSRLARVRGAVDVWVSLTEPSLAAYKSARLQQQGIEVQTRALAARVAGLSAAEQALKTELRAHRETLHGRQEALMSQLRGMGARELARVHVAHNAVAVRVQAQSLSTIAALPGVAMVRPVLNYELALSDTVPYVGAANAQAAGKDGTGVRVAVLDSGIDYTHYNLGGAGTPEAYAAAYGSGSSDAKNTTRDGLFPTAKVVDGYDFVGEVWPNGPLAEDDDPIDAPASGDTQGGHGTHVADIIGGHSADGVHKGVAPGAALVAVKVCSSVATSCSGVALLKGMDFALDPNGDGDLSDAVDVINMSLGSNYGQVEDDLSQASADAVKLGVVVVAAAGNAANRPYIVSSPSTAPGVISVAQTAVPSDKAYPLTVNSPPAIAGIYPNTATVDWAPIGAGFSGTVAAVGRGCPAAGATPEDPYLADPAGKVALIDRGVCAISLKVDRAARAGAIGVLLGLVAPGDAVSFSFGGGTMFVPTLVIQQSLSNAIKANPPANVSVGNVSIAQVGSMIGSSARGPSVSFSAIKPEIGAPGASVSAVVGTGNGQEAFGGTSGATPMVAGAAAILVQAFPQRSPEQIKALLMNSAETNINTNNALAPGVLAPITRIGAGELRVDRALALGSAARERKDQSASLSFGFQNVSSFKTLHKRLLIENFDRNGKVYAVDTNFRYANDEANGAVRIFAPPRVFVPGHGKREIDISLLIDGRKLPDWTLDGGPNGGNGALLEGVEYDGYVTLTAGDEKLSVPWQVLPRKSADFSADTYRTVKAGQSFRLANRGVTVGDFDVFSLTGISRRADGNDLPQPGDNFAFIDLRAVGVRLAAPGILQFALNTFGRRAHPNYPAEFDVAIDVNRDGNDDFVVFNAELGGFGATGQNVVSVVNLTTGQVRTFFYIDADLQSANAILTVPTAALGITDDTTFDFAVYAFDNYFTGNLTDSFGTMTYTPTTPRFVATDLPAAGVAPRSAVRIGTAAVAGGDVASPSQLGLLLMYRLDAGREAEIIRMR